jgi:hypothetical protein
MPSVDKFVCFMQQVETVILKTFFSISNTPSTLYAYMSVHVFTGFCMTNISTVLRVTIQFEVLVLSL